MVPTAQTRMTPVGEEQMAKVTTRFANLRAKVLSQLPVVRSNIPVKRRVSAFFVMVISQVNFSQCSIHLLGHTKQGGGAGYTSETIQVCTFFQKTMKIGLLDDLRTLMQVAPQDTAPSTQNVVKVCGNLGEGDCGSS